MHSLGLILQRLQERNILKHKARTEKGRAKAIAQVSSQLFNNAMEGKETSAIFFLKNRDPDNWKDRNIFRN